MAIAIYHRVMRREGFEVTAKILVDLTWGAQHDRPNESRALYLDIDGHRNESGGFDPDMDELQREFILGFLLPFYTEVHLPLMTVKNPREQDNDVPCKLVVANLEKEQDDELVSLFLENYSNTEFVSEGPVYEYLKHVSAFLNEVRSVHSMFRTRRRDSENVEWRSFWSGYITDLITELYNSFIFGNLISVTAMTRSLIESCAYMLIFDQSKDSDLVKHWLVCSAIRSTRKLDEEAKMESLETVEKYCAQSGLDFDDMVKRFSGGNENAWLSGLLNEKRVSFRDVCDYLGDDQLYEDFQYVCSFVHGQDLTTKMSPFTFYTSIYGKLLIMMEYVFRAIMLLYPNDTEMECEIDRLQTELYELGSIYVKEACS